jgi:hypothetical protein
VYTDLGTKELREMLLNEGQIEYLYSFSNERFFFAAVDHRFKFTLLGAQKGSQSDGFWATFRFNPRVAVRPEEMPAFLANLNNLIYVRRESLERFSPDSLSVMEFQTRRDYEIVERIYDDWPLLGQKIDDSWNIRFTSEFHMTNDRNFFNEAKIGVPLYEGKMIHQFDTDFAEPRFWLVEENLKYRHARLGVRAIARNTDERTLIATVLPPLVGAGNSILTVLTDITPSTSLYLAALFNSFVLDATLRLKVSANVNIFYLYQLPLPRLAAGNPYFEALVVRAAALTCTRPEFAGLWQEVMGMEWQDEGKNFQPATDPTERQRLRDELDALVAHLYGLSREDFAHILATFPLVFPPTPEGQAKKATLLAVFDRFWGGGRWVAEALMT